MDYKKLLGKRLREFRKKRGLKQEQLAEMVGLEPTSICNIENAYNYPTFQNLEKIIKALNVSFLDVFNFEHHKQNEDLLNDINIMLKNNPNKIQDVYKIVKVLVD